MAPAIPDKIPISSPRDLQQESDALLTCLALDETEHSWEKINKALKRFQAVVRGGGAKFVDEFVHVMKDPRMVKGLCRSLSTERTALSGTTLELVASCTRLGPHFAALLPSYLPTVLRLFARPHKVYVTRAATAVSSIIKNTRLVDVLRFIVLEWKSESGKSAGYREQAAAMTVVILGADTGVLAVDRDQLDKRVGELEWLIKTGAVGREPAVRADMKKCWEVYKREWPDRVASFTGPMTPTIRKYLKVSEGATAAAAAPAPTRAAPAKKALAASAGPSSSHAPVSRGPTTTISRHPLSNSVSSTVSHTLADSHSHSHSATVGMGLPSQHRSARVEPSRTTSGSTASSRSASRNEEHHERAHLTASTSSQATTASAGPARSGFKPTAPSAKPHEAPPARLASGPKPASRSLSSSAYAAPAQSASAAEPRRARRVAAPPVPPPAPISTPQPSLSRSQSSSVAPSTVTAAALSRSHGTSSSSHAPFRPKLTTSTVAAAATAAAASAKVKPAVPARAPLGVSHNSVPPPPSSSSAAATAAPSRPVKAAAPPPPAPVPHVPKVRAPLSAPTASSRARAKEAAEAKASKPSSSSTTSTTSAVPAATSAKAAATAAARERRERRAAEKAAGEAREKREKEAKEQRKRMEEEEEEKLRLASEVPLPVLAAEEEDKEIEEVDEEEVAEEAEIEEDIEAVAEAAVEVEDVEEVREEEEQEEATSLPESAPQEVPLAAVEMFEDVETDAAPSDEAEVVLEEKEEEPEEAQEHERENHVEISAVEVGMDSDAVVESAPGSQQVEFEVDEPAIVKEQVELAAPAKEEVDEEVEEEAEEEFEAVAAEPSCYLQDGDEASPLPTEETVEEDESVEVVVVSPASPLRSAPAPLPRSPSPTPLPSLAFATTPSPISTSSFAATSTPAPSAPILPSYLTNTTYAPMPSPAPFSPPPSHHSSSSPPAAPVVHFPSAVFPSFAPLSPEPFQTCSIILDTPPRFDELPGAVRMPARAAPPIVAISLPGRPQSAPRQTDESKEEPKESYDEEPHADEYEEEDSFDAPGSPSPHSPLAARRATPSSSHSVPRPPRFFPDPADASRAVEDLDTTFEHSSEDELEVEVDAEESEVEDLEEEQQSVIEDASREFDVPLNDTSAFVYKPSPVPTKLAREQQDDYDDSDSEAASTPVPVASHRSVQSTPIPSSATAVSAENTPSSSVGTVSPSPASPPAHHHVPYSATLSPIGNDTLDLATVFQQQKAHQSRFAPTSTSSSSVASPRLMEDESAIFELDRPELRFHDETEESHEYGSEFESTVEYRHHELPMAGLQAQQSREVVETEEEEEEEEDELDEDEEEDAEEEKEEEEHTNVLTRSLRSRVVKVDLENAKTPARAALSRSTRSTRKVAGVLGEVQP